MKKFTDDKGTYVLIKETEINIKERTKKIRKYQKYDNGVIQNLGFEYYWDLNKLQILFYQIFFKKHCI
ncbi:hypothetical protein M0Q97_12570 [Candidatus Dojkabacteria bacterium]|jgi:hypothetical protein|nr:hypothetical protein [Candidatus Dojkabacteria bacterium]